MTRCKVYCNALRLQRHCLSVSGGRVNPYLVDLRAGLSAVFPLLVGHLELVLSSMLCFSLLLNLGHSVLQEEEAAWEVVSYLNSGVNE
jgi:hypothetical protein